MGEGTQAREERAFLVVWGLSAIAVAWLLSPFLHVIAFALVVTIVASPMHERLTATLGGRRGWAAAITALAFALLVLLPVALVLLRFARDGIVVARSASAWVASGGLDDTLLQARVWWEAWMPAVVSDWVPEDVNLVETFAEPLRASATAMLSSATRWLPAIVEGVATGVIDVLLFVFAVVSLLAEGPRLYALLLRLSPLAQRHTERLTHVFRTFAFNLVFGAVVVALTQGVLAYIGYTLVGLPRAGFFAMVTGMAAFVPIVGTAIVALPACVYVAATHGILWGGLLAGYAVGVVGMVDNVLRPMLMRGDSEIHPILIFLAVFGGLAWIGVSGVLIGPVLMAAFVALVQARLEDLDDAAEAS